MTKVRLALINDNEIAGLVDRQSRVEGATLPCIVTRRIVTVTLLKQMGVNWLVLVHEGQYD